MDWIKSLLFDTESIAHLLLLYSFVIAVGVMLGKLKFRGISLGVAFILFTGIVAGHFGLTGNLKTIGFVQDFGLILFVYSLGLQVGPSFFTSFRKGGMRMNRLAFYMNDTEVAYLSNNKLYVTQAEILTKLIIGRFAFEPQANGNLSLIYNG